MKKFLSSFLLLCSLSYSKTEITKAGSYLHLKNEKISLSINSSNGSIVEISYKGNKLTCPNGFFFIHIWGLPPDQYGGDNRGRPVSFSSQKVTIENIENQTTGLILPLRWKTEYGEFLEKIFLPADDPYLQVTFEISLSTDVSEIEFLSEKIGGFDLNNLVFYPEEEKIGWKKYNRTPYYTIAYDKEKKVGLAILGTGKGDMDKIARQIVYEENLPVSVNMSCGVNLIRNKKMYKGDFYVFLSSPLDEFLNIWEKADKESFQKRKNIEIVKVFPDKLIYSHNEDGKIEVTLINNTLDVKNVKAECYFVKDINSEESLGEKKINFKPLEVKKISFHFSSGKEDYGREVKIKVLDERGQIIDTKSDYFTVGTNWIKYYDYCIEYPSNMPYNEEGVPWEIFNLRENYITATHIFAWYPILGDLDPKVDDWYMSEQGIRKSKKGILRFTNACKKYGIKTNFYYAIWCNSIPGNLDFAADPGKIVFNKYGQPFTETIKLDEKEAVIVPQVNIYSDYFIDYLSKEIIETIDMFGWDSIFYDCIGNLAYSKPTWNSVYHHYTYEGKNVGTLFAPTPEEAVKKWLNTVSKNIRKKHPEFFFTGNLIGPVIEEIAEDNDTAKLFKAYISNLDGVMAELGGGGDVIAKKTGVGIVENLKKHFDTMGRYLSSIGEKRRKAFPYGPFNYAGEVGTKTFLSLAFANNLHVGSWWPAPSSSYFGKPLMEYFKFRLRYSKYLYDDNLEWIPPEKVEFIEVEKYRNLYWKEYVYEKKNGKKKEIIIHFVNMPEAKFVWREDKPPIKKENIKVGFVTDEKLKCDSIYYISPDIGCDAVEIKFKKNENKVEFNIPSVEYYGMIVIRCS